MRILCFSDCHLEFRTERSERWTDEWPLTLGPRLSGIQNIDLLLLAGDISLARPQTGISSLAYAGQAGRLLGCPVVLVPGNHEYYHGDFDTDRAAMLAVPPGPVTVLDRGTTIIAHKETRLRIIGATLWTDYELTDPADISMRLAEHGVADHKMITRAGGARRFLPADARAEHQLSRAYIAEALATPHDGPTIIVTHHVPHSRFRHPGFPLGGISCAFYSDCTDLIEAAIETRTTAWLFGHHHWCIDETIGQTRFLSAQPGYPGERTGWRKPAVIEI